MGECLAGSGAWFGCGKMDHILRDFPLLDIKGKDGCQAHLSMSSKSSGAPH